MPSLGTAMLAGHHVEKSGTVVGRHVEKCGTVVAVERQEVAVVGRLQVAVPRIPEELAEGKPAVAGGRQVLAAAVGSAGGLRGLHKGFAGFLLL